MIMRTGFLIFTVLASTFGCTMQPNLADKPVSTEVLPEFIPVPRVRPQFCVFSTPDVVEWGGLNRAVQLWSDPRSNVEFIIRKYLTVKQSTTTCGKQSIAVFVHTIDNGRCTDWAGLHIHHKKFREVLLNKSCNLNQRDRLNVILHEFGHVSGVPHSNKKDSVMYFTVNGVVNIDPGLYEFTRIR